MRKFILLIGLFIFFVLFFPSGVSAQDYKGCMDKYTSVRSVCSKTRNECVDVCLASEGPADENCVKKCNNDQDVCNKQASVDYDACIKVGKQVPTKSEVKEIQPTAIPTTTEEESLPPQSDQTDQAKTKPAKQNETDEDGSPFNIFGVNPFETWLNLKELVQLPELLLDATTTMEILILEGTGNSKLVEWKYGKENLWGSVGGKDNQVTTEVDPKAVFKFSDLPKRTPGLTEDIIKQYGEEKVKMMESSEDKVSPYSIDILRGQAQIKYPNEGEWKNVKIGEKIPQGSTIITGMDTTTILTIENKGVVQIAPFSEVIINESGLEQATLNKELFNDIELNKGEIEVNIESGVYTAPILDVHTPNTTTSVRGTHFWVLYKDNQTVVGVYEGKVEVKTKDGRVKEITPNGDQPGVMVVSQKLSPIKLAVAGLVLSVILGGIGILLKRRFAAKGFGKKKK